MLVITYTVDYIGANGLPLVKIGLKGKLDLVSPKIQSKIQV